MEVGLEELSAWCVAVDLPCRPGPDGDLQVRLAPGDASVVRIVPASGEDPLAIHDTVPLDAADLAPGRLAEVVEQVVLARSSLVDARPLPGDDAAEVVVVVHADGLSRHTFVEAVFEVQKIRLLLRREVAAATAADRTVAALEALAAESWQATPAGP